MLMLITQFKKIYHRWGQWGWWALGGGYLVSRLVRLTVLPVFADEAIYIYWAQLAASDWSRFAFYPLNDGKTPLVIWAMIPLLKTFADPVWAGRLATVLWGAGGLFFTVKITALLTRRRRYQWLAGLLYLLTPGLILNQRLALMDTASTFWGLVTFYGAYLTCQLAAGRQPWSRRRVMILLLTGLSWGAALFTKLSNVLFWPMLISTSWFWVDWRGLLQPARARATCSKLWSLLWPLGIATLIGGGVFATLKAAPAFSQLFARGGDFLYSPHDFLAHPWHIMTANWSFLSQILFNYAGPLTLGAALVLGVALGWRRRDWTPLLVLISGLLYLGPIWWLGKVIYPRYVLPVIPFILISLTLSLERLRQPSFWGFKVVLWGLIGLHGGYYLLTSWLEPAQLPLVPADQEQLLAEWSAGYGIKETVALIRDLASQGRVLVLTEGHIGTLPDGLQIYFWQDPLRNQLRIEGIGQPVKNLDAAQDWLADYPVAVLVVNSHRLELTEGVDNYQLLAEYPRPVAGAPTLQVWRIK